MPDPSFYPYPSRPAGLPTAPAAPLLKRVILCVRHRVPR